MNSKFASAITIALATLAAGNALAADPVASTSRAQVQAELRDAQRTGDIMDSETGKKLNELNPSRYATKA